MSMCELRILAAHMISLAAALAMSADTSFAHGTPSEIRELQRKLDATHAGRIKSLESRVEAGTIDPADARDQRNRLEREYGQLANDLRAQYEDAMRNFEKGGRSPSRGYSDNTRPTGNAAIPRIPSTSVVDFTNPDTPPREEKPSREGESRNVGFGTRELEF